MSPQPSEPPRDAWRRAILEYTAANPDRPLKPKPLARTLHIADDEYPAFRTLLGALLAEGTLALGPGRTLTLPEQRGLFRGTFRSHPRGFGFVELPGRPDLYVPRDRTAGALEGDTVAARLVRLRGRDEPCAFVVRIVERAPFAWVGVLERRGSRYYVQPHGRSAMPRVQIDDPHAKHAQLGDLVVVEPIEPLRDQGVVRGVIRERLGPQSDTQARIRAVARRFMLPEHFPAEVLAEAHRAAAEYGEGSTWPQRRDLRDLLTITIDPATARDYDDAISLEPLADGGVRLGVHIADVAHFVPTGSALDRAALDRGNSVYFPGWVVPMLPESLSNGVCSLQPGVDRLTKSVFITYDTHARPLALEFANSLIRSHARLTYEEASALLETPPRDGDPQVVRLLRHAERLARRIQQRRRAAGMIALTLAEVEFRLDRDGNVCDSSPADTSFSHTIIEMFMIEANEAVCRRLTELDVPHIRRIHPPPDEQQRLGALTDALRAKPPARLTRAAILGLLESARGTPGERAVSYVLLRSLEQASYGAARQGHFALASDDYCHFTSPIRRYPDLVVHRLLDQTLAPRRRGASGNAVDLAGIARHCSATERRAQQAEREARTMLLLQLMKAHVGEVFDGIITGVTSFGAFVQVQPYLAEGLVRVRDFGRDDWVFDERTVSFRGLRSGSAVAIGQAARVLVSAVNDERQELLLTPAADGSFGVRRVGECSRVPRKTRRGKPRGPHRKARKRR